MSPTATPTSTASPTVSPVDDTTTTTEEEADSDSDSDSGSGSGSDSSDSGSTNDVISQSNFLRNRGVDVGGDDVTEDSDFDSVENVNAQTDSFEVTYSFDGAVDVTVLDSDDGDDGDVVGNAFGAEILAESGADGDLVSAGLGGDGAGEGEEGQGVYHLEVSLSRNVLISL